MVTIRNERPADVIAREALLDTAYGAARFGKTSERLREGRRPAEQLSFVATERGRVIGTVRLWHVWAGAGRAALLLGPLAVARARSWHRLEVDASCHDGGAAPRSWRGAAGRRCALLWPVRLCGREDLSAVDAGPLRARAPAWLELEPGALEGARGLIGATGPA